MLLMVVLSPARMMQVRMATNIVSNRHGYRQI